MTDASAQPHWLPDPQRYAVDQERQRHLDAVYTYGEFAMFVLMWRIQDFEAGLVTRCATCYLSEGKIAEVYGQGSKRKCPDCFGSTFEGGYRALIVRPSLWDHDSTEQHAAPRGDTFVSDARVQTTSDFNLNTDDYVFRRDGTRWQIRKTDWDLLRTGFQMPTVDNSMLGWNLTSVDLEDESSVAYMIPPLPYQVCRILTASHGLRFPPDFSEHEVIRGPLLPSDDCPPLKVAVGDVAVAIDSATRTGIFKRSAHDDAGGSDVAHGSATIRRNVIADTAPATDAATRVVSAHRTPQDSAPAVASTSRHTVMSRSASDSAGAADHATVWMQAYERIVTPTDGYGGNCYAWARGFRLVSDVTIITAVDTVWDRNPTGGAFNARVGLAVGIDLDPSRVVTMADPSGGAPGGGWLQDLDGINPAYVDFPSSEIVGGTRMRFDFLGAQGVRMTAGIHYAFVMVIDNPNVSTNWRLPASLLSQDGRNSGMMIDGEGNVAFVIPSNTHYTDSGVRWADFSLIGHP